MTGEMVQSAFQCSSPVLRRAVQISHVCCAPRQLVMPVRRNDPCVLASAGGSDEILSRRVLGAAPAVAAAFAAAVFLVLPALPAVGDSLPDVRPQLKVSGGAASTTPSSTSLKSVVKTVTRGVNLEGADFHGQSFEGVSFQQSILRQADFSGSSLRAASFFDADLSGANLSDADLSSANFELANLRAVNATNANLTGAFISSTTKFDGIQIEGSDWSDTFLRKDQQRYLCSRASGKNPMTGIDTRESLVCSPE